jgi:pilus assembly protein Flp/PilA
MVKYLVAWLGMKTDRRGVTMLEYSLIAALIAALCVGAVSTVGTTLSNSFTHVASSL